MIPVWRYQGPRLVSCAQCQAQVETRRLSGGPVYCPECRELRRQLSRSQANRKARMRRTESSLHKGAERLLSNGLARQARIERLK